VIVAGVKAGDEVVVEGLQRMREGIAVRRVGAEPGSDKPATSGGKDGIGGMPATAGNGGAG
jgi:hypothetical protein